MSKYAVTGFARDLVSVLENLQRALDCIPAELKEAQPAVANLAVGVEMTLKELLAAFKFKFAVKHPGAQIFFNLDDMQTLTMVWKDQVDRVTFSLDLDKVEPVDLHETRNNVSRTGEQAGSVARSGARSQHTEEEEEEQMEEAGEQAGEQKKKKKGLKKKKVVKKRKRSFDLNGMQHIKPLGYNALKDEHLKPYFYSYRVRDHLVKQSLVEKNDSDNERRVHH